MSEIEAHQKQPYISPDVVENYLGPLATILTVALIAGLNISDKNFQNPFGHIPLKTIPALAENLSTTPSESPKPQNPTVEIEMRNYGPIGAQIPAGTNINLNIENNSVVTPPTTQILGSEKSVFILELEDEPDVHIIFYINNKDLEDPQNSLSYFRNHQTVPKDSQLVLKGGQRIETDPFPTATSFSPAQYPIR